MEFRKGKQQYDVGADRGEKGPDSHEYCFFIGGFQDGLFHGFGKLTMPDGTYYEGDWEEG